MQKHKEVLPEYIDDVGQHQVTRQWVAVYDGLYLRGYYGLARNVNEGYFQCTGNYSELCIQ